MLAFTSMTPWVFRYYCLEQHVFCSILFCYNGFKARSQIIWQSSYWVSLGSLSPLLNLGRFLTTLICELLCATSEVRSLKTIELLPCYLGTFSIGAPHCQLPWGHHAWRKPKLHVLFMHGMSGCLSQVTQPLSYCIPGIWCVHEEAEASSTPPQPFKLTLLGPKILLRKEYLSLQCPVQISYCNTHYKVWGGLSFSKK